MTKVITMQNKYGIKFPYQEAKLLKIKESEEEPEKRYLWKTPGGYTFVYCDGDWKLLEKYIRDCGCIAPKDRVWITKENLALLQEEILRMIEAYQTVNVDSLRELVLGILSSEGYQPVDEDFRQRILDLIENYNTINWDTIQQRIISLISEALDNNLDIDALESRITQTLSTQMNSNIDNFKAEVRELISQSEIPANLQQRLQNIEARLTAEENKVDKDTIYNDSALRALIQEIASEHDNFITATEV